MQLQKWWLLVWLIVTVVGLSWCSAHNITSLLSKHPDFATFNHYLSLTYLDADINDRTTITVLAVNNAAMEEALLQHHSYSIYTLKNILSIHILLDYFDAKKLHQMSDGSTIVATLFQTTGFAPGTSGFVNITDLKGGKVGFGPGHTYFVKSVEEVPYNISVLHITNILLPTSPLPPPPIDHDLNLNSIMSAHGCIHFAHVLSALPHVIKTFQESIAAGGLTAFCPTDGAFRQFLPKYKNLSAPNKVSFLQFYGIPNYMSMPMLRSNNCLITNTLATHGDAPNKFHFTIQKDDDDGQGITLKTKVNTVKISTTAFDQLPLAVYALDGVLLSSDIFKAAAPAPLAPKHNSFSSAPAESPNHNSFSSAPAESPNHNFFSSVPAPAAESPKHNSSAPPDTTSPFESPADTPTEDVVDDQTASNAPVVGATVVMISILLGFAGGVLLLQPF